MMKRVFFLLFSVVSVFSSSIVTRAEDVDMRFVANSSIQKQIVGRVSPSNPCFNSLLCYLPETDRPSASEVTTSDKITMTVDEVVHKVHFTVFFINKDKVIGRAIITYGFTETETPETLYTYAVLNKLLSHLEFCGVQYSLNQSKKTSVEELVRPGEVREVCISFENACKELGYQITSDDNTLLSKLKIKFTAKCDIITEADYQEVDCEEEECAE